MTDSFNFKYIKKYYLSSMEPEPVPRKVFLFSGKRKSGKDYITDKFHSSLKNVSSTIIRLAGPIKYQFAANHGLSYEEMLTASDYKERYRKEMVDWSEAIRLQDLGHFTRAALEMYHASQALIWIVSDVRRQTDLAWFRENFPGKTCSVKIMASEKTRKERGFVFTPGIDDEGTECDLDPVMQWDITFWNDSKDEAEVDSLIKKLVQLSESNS